MFSDSKMPKVMVGKDLKGKAKHQLELEDEPGFSDTVHVNKLERSLVRVLNMFNQSEVLLQAFWINTQM